MSAKNLIMRRYAIGSRDRVALSWLRVDYCVEFHHAA